MNEPQPYQPYKGWYHYVNYDARRDQFKWLLRAPDGKLHNDTEFFPTHAQALDAALKKVKELADD